MSSPRLADYLLDQPLGTGANGTVWRATRVDDGRPVAIKLVLPGRDRRSLEREVRAMAALDHPNVLLVLDHGVATRTDGPVQEGAPYVVTELADSDLAHERPDPVTIRSALEDMLSGLAHAHARGVVHRDLKPENVLRVDGRCKLADFGLAWHGRHADGPRRAGTPAYMAPEQLRGRTDELGPWTDLYALGCIAWELWTGVSPFPGATVDDVIAAHLAAQPDLTGDVPDGWVQWVRCLLHANPGDRPAYAADAAAALQSLGDGGLVTRTAQSTASSAGTVDVDGLIDAPDTVPEATIQRLPIAPFEGSAWRPPPEEPVPLHGAAAALRTLRRWRIVGREATREHLWSRLGEVHHDGYARGVWLTGAPGAGRTRLLEWLGDLAHETGAASVVSRAAQRRDPLPPLDDLVARARPTVLLLDDVDDDLEARRLATECIASRHVLRMNVLVVLSTRAEVATPAHPIGQELTRLVDPSDHLSLGPVASEDLADLARQIAALPPATMVDLLGEAEGNPGYLIESVQRRLGIATRERLDPRLHALAEDEGQDALATLEVFAAASRPLPPDTWAFVCQRLGWIAPSERLSRLHDAGVLRGTGPLELTSPALRVELAEGARRAGRWAAIHGELAQVVANEPELQLAYGQHLHAAGKSAEAIAPLFRAAENLQRQQVEASLLLEHVLTAAQEPAGSARWVRQRLNAAIGWYMRGAHALTRPLLKIAQADAIALPDVGLALQCEAQLAAAELVDGRVHTPFLTRDVDDDALPTVRFHWLRTQIYSQRRRWARATLERTIATTDNVHHRPMWLVERSVMALFDGEPDAALAYLDHSEAMLPNQRNIRQWHVTRAAIYFQQGRLEESRALAVGALEHYRSAHNLHGVRNAIVRIAEADVESGAHSTAMDGLTVAEALDRTLGTCPAESGIARACAWLVVERLDKIREALDALRPWSAPTARADLRGPWLALDVASSSDVASSRRARAAVSEELSAGGVRTPQIALILRRGAAIQPDSGEADAIAALAESVGPQPSAGVR